MSKESPKLRKVLKYKMKEWKRFSQRKQEWLTATHEVILTDHKTTKEKIHAATDPKNIKKGLDYVGKGINKFDKAQKTFWREWDKGFDKGFGKKQNHTDKIFGKKSKVKVF